ncbi:hypothetical protein [Pseudophaeobacter sp.]|uniref:Gfo/Idh/MocA family protein n=1 Tax=Pseudophaeobacter sp. TaxID=1971739 RepID=UPI0025F6592E|nr:hypothetical protein [uncultured Pseudophaeobacter sp.]
MRQVTFRLRPGDGQGAEAHLDRQPYFQNMPRFLVHETAVHWVDTFRYLLGNPLSVYADLRRENPVIAGEDAGYVLFDHRDGVRAVVSRIWWKFSGGVLRACGFGPDQAARSSLIGAMG